MTTEASQFVIPTVRQAPGPVPTPLTARQTLTAMAPSPQTGPRTNPNLTDVRMLIAITEDAIANGQISALQSYLSRFELTKISLERSNDLLVRFLSVAATYNQKDAARNIISYWEKPIEEQLGEPNYHLPIFTSMFLTYLFSDDLLVFLIGAYPEVTFSTHITNLINYDESPDVELAFHRLAKLYGDPDDSVYQMLYDIADEDENIMIQNLIADKRGNFAPFAAKPEWVKNFPELWARPELRVHGPLPPSGELTALPPPESNIPKDEYIPFEDEVLIPAQINPVIPFPDVERAVDLATQGLENLGMTIENQEEAKQYLARVFSVATAAERFDFLQPVLQTIDRSQLSDDETLFRILGPVNPDFNGNLDTDHICTKYGGHRMFTCNCLDNRQSIDPDLDVIDDSADWFTGVCKRCHLRIVNRYYAIRRPVSMGAWTEEYCSARCLRQEMMENHAQDVLGIGMVQEMLVQLGRHGIQDRKVRPKVTEEPTPPPVTPYEAARQ